MPTLVSTAASSSGLPVNASMITLRNCPPGSSGNAARPPITRINGLAGSTTALDIRTTIQIAVIRASGANPRRQEPRPPVAPGELSHTAWLPFFSPPPCGGAGTGVVPFDTIGLQPLERPP